MASAPERLLLETARFRVMEATHPPGREHLPKKAIVRHPGAVAIIPRVDDLHVCLIENYRLSVGRVLLELPAGTLDQGEDPRLAAERELAEETGYAAQRWTRLGSFFLSPGILDEEMHLFLAEGLIAGDPRREPGELIENRVLPAREAIRMARTGNIHDAKSLVGLLLLEGLLGSP